jgi:hypothetical protein
VIVTLLLFPGDIAKKRPELFKPVSDSGYSPAAISLLVASRLAEGSAWEEPTRSL